MDYLHTLHSHGKKARSEFGWLLYLGVFNIFLGFLAISFTTLSTLLTMLYLGWLFILSGVATLFYAFRLSRIGGHTSLFIFGILAILCGVFLLLNPRGDALILTLLAAMFIGTSGLVSILSVPFSPSPYKLWVVLGGLISIACAWVIYSEWPVSGTWVPGTFLGIYLVFHGFAQVQIGATGRRFFKTSDPDSAR